MTTRFTKPITRLLAIGILAAMTLSVQAEKSKSPDNNSAFRLGKRSDNLFSLSLVPPIQVVPTDQEVNGVRLNFLYGRNLLVDGFDIGLVNHVTGDTTGAGLGLLNLATTAGGLRVGGVNITSSTQEAISVGAVNHAGSLFGTQLGLVNTSTAFAKSAVNPPRQIGLFNFTKNLKPGGIQIGLLNFSGQGGWFPVMPLINWQRGADAWDQE